MIFIHTRYGDFPWFLYVLDAGDAYMQKIWLYFKMIEGGMYICMYSAYFEGQEPIRISRVIHMSIYVGMYGPFSMAKYTFLEGNRRQDIYMYVRCFFDHCQEAKQAN